MIVADEKGRLFGNRVGKVRVFTSTAARFADARCVAALDGRRLQYRWLFFRI